MKTNKVDDILAIITNILKLKGYKEKMVDGQSIWSKGNGVIKKIQCFDVTFNERTVIIQAWLKDVICIPNKSI